MASAGDRRARVALGVLAVASAVLIMLCLARGASILGESGSPDRDSPVGVLVTAGALLVAIGLVALAVLVGVVFSPRRGPRMVYALTGIAYALGALVVLVLSLRNGAGAESYALAAGGGCVAALALAFGGGRNRFHEGERSRG